MGLTIIEIDKRPTGVNVVINRRLYLNAEKDTLVEEGDSSARFLFCVAGEEVLRKELERFDCKFATKKSDDADVEDKSDSADVEDKSDSADVEDKGSSVLKDLSKRLFKGKSNKDEPDENESDEAILE